MQWGVISVIRFNLYKGILKKQKFFSLSHDPIQHSSKDSKYFYASSRHRSKLHGITRGMVSFSFLTFSILCYAPALVMFIENSKEVSTLHLLHERSIISRKLSADSRQLGKKISTILVKKDIAT